MRDYEMEFSEGAYAISPRGILISLRGHSYMPFFNRPFFIHINQISKTKRRK
jgi:hypothetical protein